MLAELAGASLFYEKVGDGPAMVLCSGNFGGSHHGFRPRFDQLGEFATVIYHDYRAHGDSPPSSLEGVTLETYADDIEALREYLDLEKIFVFGFSFGGAVALHYALRHQDNLLGLILCSTTPAPLPKEIYLREAGKRGANEDDLAALRAILNGESGEAKMSFMKWYFKNWPPPPGPAPSQGPPQNPIVALQDRNMFDGYDLTARLSEINVPTLVMLGADDWVGDPTYAYRPFIDRIPGVEGVIFDESGHMPFVEEWPKFVSVLRDWIATTTEFRNAVG